MKIKIVTEIEIEYNPELVGIDDVVCEIGYSFLVAKHQEDVAEIKSTEIINWK